MPLPLVALVALARCSSPDPYLVGIERYRQADYLAAADQFREAVAHPANAHLEAQANIWLGLCLFNVNEPAAARLAFQSALLADRTLILPDEAPPTAQPFFDEVRRSLPAAAPAPASPPANPEPTAVPASPRPAQVEQVTESPPEASSSGVLRPWMAGVGLGLAGALGVTAGALELGAHANFASAANARYASTTGQLDRRGSSEQDAARGTGIAAASTLVVAVVLYFATR